MFGFSAGKAAYPTLYTVTATKKSSKKDSPSIVSPNEAGPSTDSLEPAIDGPPSPERIRAYTEQMKRSSIFGNNSRTNTLSSATSSFRSRDSTSASADNSSLSRRSSGRSNASSMPIEGTQLFGSIFSRSGRKSRRDNSLSNLKSSVTSAESLPERGSAREHYHGKENSHRRGTPHRSPPIKDGRQRPPISGPFNFQHVTHTRQDHLPDLARSSRMELASEFSAIRAAQAPTKGELKDIRTQDLHFDNFSSEALNTLSPEETPDTSPKDRRQRGLLRKSMSPPQRPMSFAKSHDNLRVAPPRPPRSPLSPTCPVALPLRTSSRTASVLFETFDPQAPSRIERPQTSGGFQRPSLPFDHPQPLVLEQQEYFADRPSHALTTPGDEAWPLTASPSGNFGVELTDVQEEEEEIGSRRSRISRTSSELRASQSVPSLRLRSYEQEEDGQVTRTSTILVRPPLNAAAAPRKSPLSPGFRFNDDSWEQDIDYCYEHEIEADCDYQWDQGSVEEEIVVAEASTTSSQPQLELHLEDDDRSVYHGRFRPSLLVPSAYDVPELSPMSNTSAVSSDPHTPSGFLRPNHVRSPSHASSFKESHGFNLSPTLLIPNDFQSQIEQDTLYDDHFNNHHSTSAIIFAPETYNHPTSPVDETSSSILSYRSSNFSRGSARSSSSTRISTANSRGSQDSMMFLGRAANINQAHRSIGSASSLPDLVPSSLSKLEIKQENGDRLRKGANHLTPPSPTLPQAGAIDGNLTLSPVAESFIDMSKDIKAQGQVHGRKSSAPVVSPTVREFKGRARSATTTSASGGKKKGGYMLFPQV